MESKTSSEQMVFIYPSDNLYHCIYDCDRYYASKAIEIKKSEALSRGYKKCDRCFYRYPIVDKLRSFAFFMDIYIDINFARDLIPEEQLKERNNIEFPLLLDDLRARITRSKKIKKEIFVLIRPEKIRKEIVSLLEPTKKFILEEDDDVRYCKQYLTNEILWKFTLFESIFMEWDQYISTLHHLFPDGLFHAFSFEDAIFNIFLCHSQPGFFYKVFSSEKYKSELKFHVDCLAGSIRKLIEVLKHVHVPDPRHPVNGKTLAEKIYNTYWNLFEEGEE